MRNIFSIFSRKKEETKGRITFGYHDARTNASVDVWNCSAEEPLTESERITALELDAACERDPGTTMINGRYVTVCSFGSVKARKPGRIEAGCSISHYMAEDVCREAVRVFDKRLAEKLERVAKAEANTTQRAMDARDKLEVIINCADLDDILEDES